MAQHLLILGGSPDDRRRAWPGQIPAAHTPVVLDAATLPFRCARHVGLPPAPRCLVVDGIERAFPDAQAGGTRLVLTQSTYLMQTWVDVLDQGERIVATADRAALERCAPESLQARGPWHTFEIVEVDRLPASATSNPEEQSPGCAENPRSREVEGVLARAYGSTDSAERLRLCRDAVTVDPSSPVAWLALGSACRENRDGAAARGALERAAALADVWEAVAYERGKLALVHDDLPVARAAFQRAVDLMPTFSAACSNLGATLGELGEPAAALNAFRLAAASDPHSVTTLNNIGVVCRELGRLEESGAALRQAIAIEPRFVFGHYNLGHTLFLAGRYRDALAAYEEGQRRDPAQNRRQGCRLALTRLANGDAAGAERDLWRFANAATDEREALLLEAYEIAHALLARYPALEPHRPFLDRIGLEIAKSE